MLAAEELEALSFIIISIVTNFSDKKKLKDILQFNNG